MKRAGAWAVLVAAGGVVGFLSFYLGLGMWAGPLAIVASWVIMLQFKERGWW